MCIRSLPAPSRLLDLPILDLRPRLNDLVLARRCDASLLQLLRHGLVVRNLDLLPDLPEFRFEVLDKLRVIRPYHLWVVILLVPRNKELPILLERVDRLHNGRPSLA